MPDAQCYQNIRLQIATHVCMQIRMEFAVIKNIGFHYRLEYAETVVFCLAHQGFGNSRDRRFHLYASVRKNVGNLCISHPENIHAAV